MFCSKCGKLISDDAQYCRFCGAETGVNDIKITDRIDDDDNSFKRISLRCKNCSGVMQVNQGESVMTAVCPFCGSHELLAESEDVVIHRMHTDAYREVELKKIELEEKKLAQQAKYVRRGNTKVTMAFMIFFLIFFFFEMSSNSMRSGSVVLVQFILFSLSYLMDKDIIGVSKPTLPGVLRRIGFLLIIVWVCLI